MTAKFTKIMLVTAALGLAGTAAARADCEADLIKLEQAFKTPNLSDGAKTALDSAKVTAVAALKKDDDKTCHTAIADAMTKAGMKLN